MAGLAVGAGRGLLLHSAFGGCRRVQDRGRSVVWYGTQAAYLGLPSLLSQSVLCRSGDWGCCCPVSSGLPFHRSAQKQPLKGLPGLNLPNLSEMVLPAAGIWTSMAQPLCCGAGET